MEVQVIRPVHVVFPHEYLELVLRGADVENYHFWAYVAPEDVAQAFALALAAPYTGYDVFTIAAADGLNRRPTLEVAAERWNPLPEVCRPSIYDTNPHASVLDITKARNKLGYVPQVTWRDMLNIQDIDDVRKWVWVEDIKANTADLETRRQRRPV